MKLFKLFHKKAGRKQSSAEEQSVFNLTDRDCFQILYNRDPSSDELRQINQASEGLTSGINRKLRAIIARVDRQFTNTPFLIRFTEDDVAFLNLGRYELAIDTADIAISLFLQSTQQYEPHLTKFVCEYLKPGMTFVDVGANIGYYSMLASHLIGETGKVFAFEPNSDNCRLLLLSIAKNHCTNIELHPIGLSDKRGFAYFSTHFGSNGGLFSSSEEVLLSGGCSVIPTVRLDDFALNKIDMIKIDVEGAEGLVIKGAQQMIKRDRPIVTSEFSLEMLARVSGITGKEYLMDFCNLNYKPFMIDRSTKELVEILNIDLFLGNYGSSTRIEDFVFLPQ